MYVWTLIISFLYTPTSPETHSHIVVDNIPTYEACVQAQQKHLDQFQDSKTWTKFASTCVKTLK